MLTNNVKEGEKNQERNCENKIKYQNNQHKKYEEKSPDRKPTLLLISFFSPTINQQSERSENYDRLIARDHTRK